MICANLFIILIFIDEVLHSTGDPVLPGGWRVDCVRANELCMAEPGCSSRYRTLRQCLAGKAAMLFGPEAKNECIAAVVALQRSPLFDCRCKRAMKKEKQCLAIYWSIHQSLQQGKRAQNLTYRNGAGRRSSEERQRHMVLGGLKGDDLYESSPYEPVNSRLSDIFRLAAISSGMEPMGARGNQCLDAAKACNLNDTCKRYRSSYISTCVKRTSPSDTCSRRKCHKSLRQFFDRVPAEYSYRLLFCSCNDPACAERRRQTIVPVCSYEDKEKLNCLALHQTCKMDHVCRSRLADFLSNCQPSAQSLSGCFRENYAACLLSYSGLIGSDMTPNYIDATDIVVAPWCTCSGSGNQKEECDKFLNYFKVNACLRNAMQAFGNGTDVNMWKTSLPTLATLLLKTEKTIESAQPSDHIKEITTADDANIFTMCSDLQENGPKFNTSKEQSLCLPEAQAPALNKDKIKDMDKMPSYTDPRNGHSFGARIRASVAWVAISFYIITTLTS
ncbi:GDNF family receptor alpha-2-like isoform X1 [Carcharodon carcharias]|uniref:GDNF family receptor alpha-2-like isoform X1 n=1 Tax=Carcharodon carcharias TaxID=13397 RepID=UPI001B7DC181|nr:GDNF family receptor alpha-2-like isoform X1 [Carcharodon carcharias]